MKIYSILITVVAVLALAASGYLYWQDQGIYNQLDVCQKDKALVESRLTFADGQLAKANKTIAAFKAINEAFLIAGDLKALSVGTQEAAEVEQRVGEIADKQDRMSAEANWQDFKATRKLNSLFALFRNLADNLERTAQQPSNQNLPD